MAWCDCICGHHRSNHPWTGFVHAGCGMCRVCQKPSKDHVYVAHQFQRCHCNEFQETA